MSEELLETLSLHSRLALSYAPRAARGPTLTLLALDQRLASILRAGGEPIIAQMKLAWWRDRFAEPREAWPEGEPLLAALHGWPGETAHLAALVDGWESLLAEHLDTPSIAAFAEGRAAGWSALAGALQCAQQDVTLNVAREWALVDLAVNLGGKAERDSVRQIAKDRAASNRRLPRKMRTLAVLHALARRAQRRNADALLEDPRSALLALRVGITGR